MTPFDPRNYGPPPSIDDARRRAKGEGAHETPPPTDQDIFDDLVERGIKARQGGDDARWQQGDLAVEFCRAFDIDPKAGRPAAGRGDYTLSFYAEQTGAVYRTLSEYRLCSAFYPVNVRRAGDYATWAHHNRARRAADGKLDNALELLESAATLHLGADDFDAWCKGEYFAGKVEWAKLPPWLQEIVPLGQVVWMAARRYDADGEG